MKRFLRNAALALAAVLTIAASVPAFGQVPPTPIGGAVLCNTCSVTLSVSSTSSNVALPSANTSYNVLTIKNSGANDGYLALGGSGITASNANILIRAGRALVLWTNGATYVAGYSASPTTFDVYQANGAVLLQDVNPTGGSGETVAANQGTQNAGGANSWWMQLFGGASAAAAPSTNASSTITTGSTFQQIAASNASRLSFEFQNQSGNGDQCWLYWGTTISATKAKSIVVKDGKPYSRFSGVVPSDAIQVTCATTADAYYAEVQ